MLTTAISTFLAVISGLILYILKDLYSKHQSDKAIKKVFKNEIAFNIKQMNKFKEVLGNWQNAVDSNGHVSLSNFNKGKYNADFTYSAAIFTQLVNAGIIFELVEHPKLESLDRIYKNFQHYSTTGQYLNSIVNDAIINNKTISRQEDRNQDYVFIGNLVAEIDTNTNFLKEIKDGIFKKLNK